MRITHAHLRELDNGYIVFANTPTTTTRPLPGEPAVDRPTDRDQHPAPPTPPTSRLTHPAYFWSKYLPIVDCLSTDR
jgi:hypothetical protein